MERTPLHKQVQKLVRLTQAGSPPSGPEIIAVLREAKSVLGPKEI